MTENPEVRSTFTRRLRRWFATPEQKQAEERLDHVRQYGSQAIADSRERTRVTFHGTVTDLATNDESGWLEAHLEDGTGQVKLVWMGRKRLECVAPGCHLVVHGRLTNDEGERVIYNPDFSVVS